MKRSGNEDKKRSLRRGAEAQAFSLFLPKLAHSFLYSVNTNAFATE